MNNESKLGLFVTLGIIAIAVSIMLLGNFDFKSKYIVNAYFDNASGLPKKAKVKIAGVDVGHINNIILENEKAKIILNISSGVKLYSDASATIVATGIIGTKYIEIIPGTSTNRMLKDGDTINTVGARSVEDMIANVVDQVSKVLGNVSSGINEEFFKNLSDTVKNLKKVSQTIADKEKEIAQVITNFNKFSGDLAEITSKNKEDIRNIVLEIKKVSLQLDEFMTKINKGKGTIGTLVNDEEMATELKQTISSIKTTVDELKTTFGKASHLEIDWEYMYRYDTRAEKSYNDFGIRFRPNPNKFYYLGISNIANSKDVLPEDRDNINKLDALIGFRSKYLEVYGGAIRSTGGLGAGYSPYNPIADKHRKLYFNVEIFDTNSQTTDKKPNITAGARLGVFHWLYAGVQAEHITSNTSWMPYIKVKITDQDISSLFGVAAIAATSSSTK
ncbi:MAG: MlaD family protein [Endomicrobiaceae bacterium]|nr:MlaD family protein [Endomicrobiaceae bacterium]